MDGGRRRMLVAEGGRRGGGQETAEEDGRVAGENRIIHPHLLHEEQLSPEKALEYSLFTFYLATCFISW